MSKKKGKKGGKKTETTETIPIKTAFQTLYEENIHAESLTLSQQKKIVSVLGLSDYSLFDSMVIEIMTDFLRFMKKIQLTAKQTIPIYHILQHILYKLMNEKECNLDQCTNYLHQNISLRIITKEIENASDTTSNQAITELLNTQQSQSILEFMQLRILSQYALYRAALFHNNPSHLRYIQFKKDFEVDDVVRFQNEECLFKIEQFRPNHVVLICLHDDFKSISSKTENEKSDEDVVDHMLKYNVSRDQLQFISFVSKSIQEVENKETPIVEENEDEAEKLVELQEKSENRDITNDVEPIETVEKEDKLEEEPVETKTKNPNTFLDMIVDKKVEQKLKSMQQQFDKQLEEYKQQIQQLQA